MKRLSKPVSIVIALVILLFSALSVCGFSYYEGDIRKVVVKGFGDLDWGLDVNGGSKIVLTAATDDEAATDECIDNLYKSADIIDKRIAAFGLTDCNLYVAENLRQIVLEVPHDVDCQLSAEEVAMYLSAKGEFSIRPGNSNSDYIIDSSHSIVYLNPSDSTAARVIVSGENISNAYADAATFTNNDTNENMEYESIYLQFNNTGAELINNAVMGEFFGQDLSVWLDNVMLSPRLDGDASNGYLFTGDGFTAEKAKLFAAVIANGSIPSDLAITSSTNIAPVVENNSARVVLFTGIAAIAVIVLVLIIKYRLAGVVGVLSGLFQFSLILAILTGFCFNKDGGTFLMTIPGAAGLFTAVLLTILSCIVFSEKIKSKLNHGTIPAEAVAVSLKKSGRLITDINFIVAIVSVIGMFIFGGFEFVLLILGGSITGGIFSFCYVLFLGSVLNFITGYVVTMLMMRSLTSFKCFNKATLFGGAKK